MRIYADTIERFKDDVTQNRISDMISASFKEKIGRNASPSEKNSWNNSLNFVKNAIDYAALGDNYIVVEYQLPYSEKRIDVILFGHNVDKEPCVLVMELKQWSNDNV